MQFCTESITLVRNVLIQLRVHTFKFINTCNYADLFYRKLEILARI